MNKIVIVEGPDCSGKSTLVKELQEMSGATVFHEGPPPVQKEVLHYYAQKLVAAAHFDKPVIFDRFHLGELVYPMIVGRPTDFGDHQNILMDRLCNGLGVKVVICMPESTGLFQRWHEKNQRDEEFLKSPTDFAKSFWAFKSLCNIYPAYDFESAQEAAIFKHQMKKYFRSWVGVQPLPYGTIGYKDAQFLLVGERANHDTLDLPFFYMKNSSGFLNRALWEAGFKEHEMVFTNAYTINGVSPRNLREITSMMPNLKKVLCLGRWPERVAKGQNIPYSYIPHPSYISRFGKSFKNIVIRELRALREEALA